MIHKNSNFIFLTKISIYNFEKKFDFVKIEVPHYTW